MINLTCKKCLCKYDKLDLYNDLYNKTKNIYYKMNLEYCDKCRREIEQQAIKNIPLILTYLTPHEKRDRGNLNK